MNKFLRIVPPALLLVALTVRGAETNQLKSLPLRECVERALANNLEIRAERINPSIQTWGIAGAQGVYDPVLTGGINYQDATIPQDAPAPALTQQSFQPTLGLAGKLATGATYDFAANDTRTSGTVVTNFLYTGHYRMPAIHTRLNEWYTRIHQLRNPLVPCEKLRTRH